MGHDGDPLTVRNGSYVCRECVLNLAAAAMTRMCQSKSLVQYREGQFLGATLAHH